MAAQIIKGRDLMLFDNQGKSYAYATNHTLSITAETTDISSKDHGSWGANEIAKYSWEITSENLYTTTGYDAMFDAMVAGVAITVRFGLKSQADNSLTVADGDYQNWTAGSGYYEGKVFITSLVANANNGENATYSVTLTGSGKITRNGNNNGGGLPPSGGGETPQPDNNAGFGNGN